MVGLTQCLSHSKCYCYLAIDLLNVYRWLGQNSKQNKLGRQLGEVQTRMRLKVSADKNEIRQSYIPALFPHVVQPLVDVGAVSG